MRLEVGLYDEKLKESILNLKYSTSIDDNGQNCDMVFIPKSDYGYAEIYRMYDDILCFTIPEYGGTPSLTWHVGRHSVDYLISELKK